MSQIAIASIVTVKLYPPDDTKGDRYLGTTSGKHKYFYKTGGDYDALVKALEDAGLHSADSQAEAVRRATEASDAND